MNIDENKTEQIFESIKSGNVTMRPRWYFILRDAIGMVAIVIVLLIAVYLASFTIFVLHESGAWFVPVFGLAGWYALFNALPLILILFSAVFVVILAWLVKRYQFGYQWPLLYSFLGAIFLIAAVSFLFIQSSFYNELFAATGSQGLPLIGGYYPGVGVLEPNDIHRGTILLTGSNGFVLRDNVGNVLNIFVSTSTNMAIGTILRAGDIVVVFGDRSATGTVFAIGIEKIAH